MGILSELEIKYDFDVVNDFMTHFGVMSMSLDPLVVGLEQRENFERNLGEIIHIFRNLHSAAKFLKLEAISKFTTLCLNICEGINEVKTPNCKASHEVVDWLLLAADQLENYRRDLENDNVYFGILNPKLIKTPYELIVE